MKNLVSEESKDRGTGGEVTAEVEGRAQKNLWL